MEQISKKYRTGANIGLNFKRLFEGDAPLRSMTDDEREFHCLNLNLAVECVECDDLE